MDQIDIISSEDTSQTYSDLSYVQDSVFQNQEEYHLIYDEEITFTNQEKLIDLQQPTYNQIINIIQAISIKYPQRSLDQIVNKLYTVKFPQQSSQKNKHKINFNSYEQKHRYFMQCRYAAKSFIDFQYGVKRMRKVISINNLSLQITAVQYNNIINRLFYSSFKRLENFVNQKFQPDQSHSKHHRGVLCKFDLKALLQVIKYCRKFLDPSDIHVLFKIIASTANNQTLKLSKTLAVRLYKSIILFVSTKRKRVEGQQRYLSSVHLQDSPINIQQQELINELNFNKQKLNCFMDLYIKQPSSLFNITKAMKNRYPSLQQNQLFKQSFLKLQLQKIINEAIHKIKQDSQLPQIIQKGVMFKKLVHLNEQNIKLIKQSSQAAYLRATLCQYYKMIKFDENTLICTILQINQYIKKIEHEKIIQNLKISKQVNSICRQQYEFGGKRKKILMFKKPKKQKRKPTFH